MTSDSDHSLDRIDSSSKKPEMLRHWRETIRRAFTEFLKIPTFVIALGVRRRYLLDDCR